MAGEPLCSLRWCRLEAGASRNEEEQPAGWGGLLALLTVLSSPVRVGRLEMLSVSDKSLSQERKRWNDGSTPRLLAAGSLRFASASAGGQLCHRVSIHNARGPD